MASFMLIAYPCMKESICLWAIPSVNIHSRSLAGSLIWASSHLEKEHTAPPAKPACPLFHPPWIREGEKSQRASISDSSSQASKILESIFPLPLSLLIHESNSKRIEGAENDIKPSKAWPREWRNPTPCPKERHSSSFKEAKEGKDPGEKEQIKMRYFFSSRSSFSPSSRHFSIFIPFWDKSSFPSKRASDLAREFKTSFPALV